MEAAEFENDISLGLAGAAHQGTSFSPETRAEQERRSYANELAADYKTLSRYATTDEKKALLETEFARYRAGYRSHYVAYLSAKSRCVSTMIAGPSGFNTSRAQKRSSSADKRLEDLCTFRERALDAVRKTLCPELRPIMLGDADAVERVDGKLETLKKKQTAMKEANAAIRKHKKAGAEAQIAALVALGFSEGRAKDLLTPDFMGRIGFPAFEITNNAANIRRLESRKVVIERVKVTPETVVAGANARLEDVPADNRVRLFFSGKPATDVRDRLKVAGFRWTPSLECWQAYRSDRTLATARVEAGL